MSKRFKVCSCNGTIKFDAAALSRALHLPTQLSPHRELCRRESGHFIGALGGDDLVVGCTQEAALFEELAQQEGEGQSLKFVNLRECAGWSAEGALAQPKMAALLALAALPEPEPVAAVSYRSAGATLIVGPLAAALAWAEELKDQVEVSVLGTDARGELPIRRDYPVRVGASVKVQGHLGRFQVSWDQGNPIDLDLCTRCNACIRACPEAAIGYAYQVDAAKCRAHRSCVEVCEVGAIDFKRSARARTEDYDLVLDLCAPASIRRAHLPQGYFAPGRDPLDQSRAVRELLRLVGEFEKPTYASVKERLCAHSRNRIEGCRACLDVCSAEAIRPQGDHVAIDAHLCLGCGGCATACPTGAVRHIYPSVPHLGLRIKTLLATYREAGGTDPVLLVHKADADAPILELGRRGKGLPARVIPFPVHDVACVGLDVLLGALAHGAAACVILSQGDEPESYTASTARQLDFGNRVLDALGHGSTRLQQWACESWQALGEAVWALPRLPAAEPPASFNLMDDKRAGLAFALDHLARHAPRRPEQVPLPAGAPWGSVELDKDKCTLCMSCVGACPASALMDAPDAPRLKFVERNCVQCGLCVKTCPESALKLAPRLLLTEEARRERVLNEAEPFHCVRCGKPFGTRQMMDAMLGRLASHSMFGSEEKLRRLQMCADCRVVDMMENKQEMSIFDATR